MSEHQRRGWSDMNSELLELILQRLTLLDFLKCREVCLSWQTIVDDACATKERCHPAPHFPFLLVLHDACNKPDNLLDLTQNKIYTMETKFRLTDWVASFDGWLIIQNYVPMDGVGKSYGLLRVYNPVSRLKFMLPKLSLFPDCDLDKDTISSSSIVFSSKPDSRNLIMAISILIEHERQYKQQLSFCRPTDKSWTLIKTDEDRTMIFTDIAIQGCKLYAITEDKYLDFVFAFDLTDPNTVEVERLVIVGLKPNLIIPQFDIKRGLLYCTDLVKPYLVEDSTCGNLLLVLHLYDQIAVGDEYVISTTGFQIFRLDMCGLKWLEVDNLSDRFLLLDVTGLQLIPSANLSGPWNSIRDNCVYFALANYRLPVDSPLKWDVKHDAGVFSLSDKTIRNFPLDHSLQISSQNLWFTPSL